MDIKEIALKVRATTPVSPDPDKYVEDLFTNFVAEIQRQNPQVGLATLGKAMLSTRQPRKRCYSSAGQ